MEKKLIHTLLFCLMFCFGLVSCTTQKSTLDVSSEEKALFDSGDEEPVEIADDAGERALGLMNRPEMARAHGIKLKAAKRVSSLPTATLLAQHHSPPLDLMLKAMLKYSNNLMAEMIGMTATGKRGKSPKGLKDSAAEMSRWARAKYGVSAIRMVDHSGLGEASRVAPHALLKVLVAAYKTGSLKPLLKSFPMRDGNGRIVKNHPIKVTAKTGTLNFVSGLGGFLTTSSGTVLAFAIFAADSKARARISRTERERPAGARSWNKRAKRLQQQLIERWGQSFGT